MTLCFLLFMLVRRLSGGGFGLQHANLPNSREQQLLQLPFCDSQTASHLAFQYGIRKLNLCVCVCSLISPQPYLLCLFIAKAPCGHLIPNDRLFSPAPTTKHPQTTIRRLIRAIHAADVAALHPVHALAAEHSQQAAAASARLGRRLLAAHACARLVHRFALHNLHHVLFVCAAPTASPAAHLRLRLGRLVDRRGRGRHHRLLRLLVDVLIALATRYIPQAPARQAKLRRTKRRTASGPFAARLAIVSVAILGPENIRKKNANGMAMVALQADRLSSETFKAFHSIGARFLHTQFEHRTTAQFAWESQ